MTNFEKLTNVLGTAKLENFAGFLSPRESGDYFREAQSHSALQALCRRVPLGADGEAITQVVGDGPMADWVLEGDKKPISSGRNVGMRVMRPKKIAVIVVSSAEVVRKNPTDYITRLRGEIGEGFGKAFDMAGLYGLDITGTEPRDPFNGQWLSKTPHRANLADTSQSIWHHLNRGVLSPLVTSGRKLGSFALAPLAEVILNDETDANGRPIYSSDGVYSSAIGLGRLMSRPFALVDGIGQTFQEETAQVHSLGFAGDFSKVVWGTVGGLSYSVSTEAAVTLKNENGNDELVSLWEHNLVGVLAEAEYGLMMDDPTGGDFVMLTAEDVI